MSVLTRRQTILLAAGAPAAAGLLALPGLVVPPAFEDRLRAILDGLTPHRLTLRHFREEKAGMRAALELAWPPGTRRRVFTATGPVPERAFEALVASISGHLDLIGARRA